MSKPAKRRKSSSAAFFHVLLFPVSWIVGFAAVYVNLEIMAAWQSTSIGELMKTGQWWPGLLIVPSFLFGKMVGLMISNLIGYCLPPVRREFERESEASGRPGFSAKLDGLLRVSAGHFAITVTCALIFVLFAPR
ncbi:MAG TPA: hypothetical protein PLS03_05235 [Terrimicrobiaceae bacterium]|nr:hypothetical protein [Terrimicrobiaceae bacterium]